MTDCFRAAALTGWANFISWKFPSILIYFIGKRSQNAGAGILYIRSFSLLEGKCQDVEVHLIVRTRQWLSKGEGRTWALLSSVFLVTKKWGSLQGAPSEWAQGGFERSFLQAGNLNTNLPNTSAGPSRALQLRPPPAAHGCSGTSGEEHKSSRKGKWSGADEQQKYWMWPRPAV